MAGPVTPGRRRATQNGSIGRAITAPTGYRAGQTSVCPWHELWADRF